MEEHKVCVTDKEYDEGKEGNYVCVLGRWLERMCSQLLAPIFLIPSSPSLFLLYLALFPGSSTKEGLLGRAWK